jgi:F-type H+-transporting ATPase subunit a
MEIITRFGNLIAAGSKHAGEEGGHHVEVSPLASFYGLFVLFGITFIAIAVFLLIAKQGLNSKFFRQTSSQLLEQLYVFVEGLAVGIIGPHGRKYIPMMMVFWLVIFFGNLLALLIHSSPTSDLSFNLGMALVAMGYVQFEGMRANGVFGHLSHFAGPKLPLAMIPITLMIFVIELISEMMKNVSLSLRLYGNIFGGGEAVTAMNKLGAQYGVPWLNFGDFLFPIKLLTCVVQALIFCLLFAVYLSLVTHHEHEEGHDHESHGEAVPAH